MPRLPQPTWYDNRSSLTVSGIIRVEEFCNANSLPEMPVKPVQLADWDFSVCAYWRKATGCNICLPKCARLAGEANSRNWNWPASVTDREPFGVICHELGHHCDWHKAGDHYKQGSYFSGYSTFVRQASCEAPITSYCPNDAEWFAEMMRLFITNHALLKSIRPKTWQLLRSDWKPVSSQYWEYELGSNVPARILRTLRNKMQ